VSRVNASAAQIANQINVGNPGDAVMFGPLGNAAGSNAPADAANGYGFTSGADTAGSPLGSMPFAYEPGRQYAMTALLAQNGVSDAGGGVYDASATGVPSPVDDSVQVEITFGPERTSLMYGAGYAGALSQWTPSGLIDSMQINLNASAFRSAVDGLQTGAASIANGYAFYPVGSDGVAHLPTISVTPGNGSVDEMGQPLNGPSNYDAFARIGQIWSSDASLGTKLGQTWEWANYTVPDAQQQIARRFPVPSVGAATLDNMLTGPIPGVLAGATYLMGGTNADAYTASQLGKATQDTLAGLAGLQMPRAPQPYGLASAGRMVGGADEVPNVVSEGLTLNSYTGDPVSSNFVGPAWYQPTSFGASWLPNGSQGIVNMGTGELNVLSPTGELLPFPDRPASYLSLPGDLGAGFDTTQPIG
jgi:hypothetical protein